MSMQEDYRNAVDRIEISPDLRREVLTMKTQKTRRIPLTRITAAAASAVLVAGMGGALGWAVYSMHGDESSQRIGMPSGDPAEEAALFQQLYRELWGSETDYTFPGMICPLDGDWRITDGNGEISCSLRAALFDGYQLLYCYDVYGPAHERGLYSWNLASTSGETTDTLYVEYTQRFALDDDCSFRAFANCINYSVLPISPEQYANIQLYSLRGNTDDAEEPQTAALPAVSYQPPAPQLLSEPVVIGTYSFSYAAVTPLGLYLYSADPADAAGLTAKSYDVQFARYDLDDAITVTALDGTQQRILHTHGWDPLSDPDTGLEIASADYPNGFTLDAVAISFTAPLDTEQTASLTLCGTEIPVTAAAQPPLPDDAVVDEMPEDTLTGSPALRLMQEHYRQTSGSTPDFDFHGFLMPMEEQYGDAILCGALYDGMDLNLLFSVPSKPVNENDANYPGGFQAYFGLPDLILDSEEIYDCIIPLNADADPFRMYFMVVVYDSTGKPYTPTSLKIGGKAFDYDALRRYRDAWLGSNAVTGYCIPPEQVGALTIGSIVYDTIYITPFNIILSGTGEPEAYVSADAEISVIRTDGVTVPLQTRQTGQGNATGTAFQRAELAEPLVLSEISGVIIDGKTFMLREGVQPPAQTDEPTDPQIPDSGEGTPDQTAAAFRTMTEEARSLEMDFGTVTLDNLRLDNKGVLWLDYSLTPKGTKYIPDNALWVSCIIDCQGYADASDFGNGIAPKQLFREENLVVDGANERIGGAYHFSYCLGDQLTAGMCIKSQLTFVQWGDLGTPTQLFPPMDENAEINITLWDVSSFSDFIITEQDLLAVWN